MDKQQFEDAVYAGIDANSQNSRKWKPLERLFEEEGVRASGVVVNEDKQKGNRVQQLFDGTRRHGDSDAMGYNKHSVAVLNADSADAVVDDPTKVNSIWVSELDSNRPAALPASISPDSVILFRNDRSTTPPSLVPLVLVEWAKSAVTERYREWFPGIEIIDRTAVSTTPAIQFTQAGGPHQPASASTPLPAVPRNIIISGAPGVGKSYIVAKETEGATVFRTTFHPETTYGQFVGEYKVVVGFDAASQITAYDGTSIDRPVSYFAFEPAPLVMALVCAVENPTQTVALIIEEINRGDCAAAFGDFFQLLDRDSAGESEYAIHLAPSLASYLTARNVLGSPSEPLRFPSNLFLYATMNTSDQSLYPMDGAFKRRWDWRTVPVMQGREKLKDVFVDDRRFVVPLRWIDLVAKLNDRIAQYGQEDKRIGPWLLKANGEKISASDIKEKLLHYLWYDVFRARRGDLFDSSQRTFDDVLDRFDAGGIAAVMPALFEEPADESGALGGGSGAQPANGAADTL